jgi:hypothetical protein
VVGVEKCAVAAKFALQMWRASSAGGRRDTRDKRRWFSVKGAAKAVNEPDLVDILSELTGKPRKHPVVGLLRKTS